MLMRNYVATRQRSTYYTRQTSLDTQLRNNEGAVCCYEYANNEFSGMYLNGNVYECYGDNAEVFLDYCRQICSQMSIVDAEVWEFLCDMFDHNNNNTVLIRNKLSANKYSLAFPEMEIYDGDYNWRGSIHTGRSFDDIWVSDHDRELREMWFEEMIQTIIESHSNAQSTV